ncbi:MAG: carboxypeptidase regulatory-like domain-containing protein [Lewinellaceae bacterium]|nr:carboxypeptidase regulatory-like domain-containing protein [Saprospiraceae bacterium]MCB9342791.1 carboxypeptidase regulatory-like domain-containing protein [Lewinellaceae bacterium]
MSKITRYSIFLLILIAGLSSCLKDILNEPIHKANLSFSGRVIDDAGHGISGAKVRAGGDVVTTNANGNFALNNLLLDARDAKIFVTKIGYFEFSRAYMVESNSTQDITIQLIEKNLTNTIDASSGGTVEIPGGAKLIFPANAIITETGQPYNGNLRVFATYLNPTDPNLNLYMPGDLRGIDNSGNEMALRTYGMIGVELEDNGGQKLRIAQGKTVAIRLPIAPSQTKSAPTTIPLWHYDLDRARWIEEGSLQRNGDEYVGTVSHFSFWNADVSFNLIELSGKVYIEDDQHPYVGARIQLTMTSDSSSSSAKTDASGCFKGGVPEGETFIMEILDKCGNVIYTETIGPFDQNTMLPPIILPDAGPNQISFTGVLLDCDSFPVSNGYVTIQMDNQSWKAFTDINGVFNIRDVRCDTTMTEAILTGFDLSGMLQSAPDTVSVPPDSIDFGYITVCDTLNEFVSYTLDNVDYVLVDPSAGIDSITGMFTYITGSNSQTNISLSFKNNNQTGTYPMSNFWVGTLNVSQPPTGLSTAVDTIAPSVGDIIEGDFSGTFLDVFGTTHTITGHYRAKRDY